VSVAVRAPRTGWAAKTTALIAKDLRVEVRARETLPPMLVFSLAVTLLLAFTLPTSGPLEAPRTLPGPGLVVLADVLAGFLWVTVLFAGLIGFARTFEVDRADGALDVLLLVPLDRSGLFAAKAMANLVSLVVLEVILFPVFALFFGIDLVGVLGPILLVIALVDVGFTAIGTLFSSLAAQTRSRELMLPILALPALVPVFIAAVELTSDLFIGGGLGAVTERGWFGILIAFDVIFVTLGALAFEFTLD
jgi:heme exporter protein B